MTGSLGRPKLARSKAKMGQPIKGGHVAFHGQLAKSARGYPPLSRLSLPIKGPSMCLPLQLTCRKKNRQAEKQKTKSKKNREKNRENRTEKRKPKREEERKEKRVSLAS